MFYYLFCKLSYFFMNSCPIFTKSSRVEFIIVCTIYNIVINIPMKLPMIPIKTNHGSINAHVIKNMAFIINARYLQILFILLLFIRSIITYCTTHTTFLRYIKYSIVLAIRIILKLMCNSVLLTISTMLYFVTCHKL